VGTGKLIGSVSLIGRSYTGVAWERAGGDGGIIVGVGVGTGVGVGGVVGVGVAVGGGDGGCGLLWGTTIVGVGATVNGIMGTTSPRAARAVVTRTMTRMNGVSVFLIPRLLLPPEFFWIILRNVENASMDDRRRTTDDRPQTTDHGRQTTDDRGCITAR
jgi:hypothetical protein